MSRPLRSVPFQLQLTKSARVGNDGTGRYRQQDQYGIKSGCNLPANRPDRRRSIHMSSLAHQSSQEKAIPAIYRLQRMFLALSIVLGPAFGLAAIVIGPGYSSTQNGPASMLALF